MLWTEWYQKLPEFNLVLIFSLIAFWFVTVVPKYLNFALLSGDETSTCTWFLQQQQQQQSQRSAFSIYCYSTEFINKTLLVSCPKFCCVLSRKKYSRTLDMCVATYRIPELVEMLKRLLAADVQ
jgi:hypothetical protein